MRIFKRVYLSLLAVLMALVICAGFITALAPTRRAEQAVEASVFRYAQQIDRANQGSPLAADLRRFEDSRATRNEILNILRSNEFDVAPARNRHASRMDEDNVTLFDFNNTEEFAWGSPASMGHNIYRSRVSFVDFAEPHGNTNPLSNRFIVQPHTFDKIAGYDGNDNLTISLDRQVNNIVVVAPGNATKRGEAADAVLLTTHMDFARSGGGGAAAATMGAFLNQIRELRYHERNCPDNSSLFEHDVIFLFTDARFDSSFGIHVFMDQFFGFSGPERELYNGAWRARPGGAFIPNIVERIRLAVNFDSIGTGATALLLQTSENNNQLVSAFARATGGVSSSVVSDFYRNFPSDFNGFFNAVDHNRSEGFTGHENLAAMNIVTYGNLRSHNTVFDRAEDTAAFRRLGAVNAQMVSGVLHHFGNADLNNLDNQRAVNYFSVLGMFTVRHSNIASFILGIILLLLFAGAIAANVFKKAYSFGAVGKGLAVQLLSIAATIASLFLLHFVAGIIMVFFFRAFTIQHLITMTHSNPGILIGYALFATALMALFTAVFKRFFEIKATDAVRGGAWVFSIAAIVLAFVYPPLGFMVGIPAVLTLVNLTLCTVLKNAFASRFKFDIERLFLYLIPMMVLLAFVLPTVTLIAPAAFTILTPFLILPFIMVLMFIAPYTPLLKGAFDRVLGKVPPYTVRIKRFVTEQVEDKAKPGKFTEVSGEKIEKVKVKWKYRHGVGVTILAVVSAMIIMISSAWSAPFGGAGNIRALAPYGQNQFTNNIYQSSMLLVSETGMNPQLRIYDKATFRRARGWVRDFSWDNAVGAYTKNVAVNIPSPGISSPRAGGFIVINPAVMPGGFGTGLTEVRIYNASNILAVNIYQTLGDSPERRLEIPNTERRDTITLRLPMDSGRVYVGFEYTTAVPSQMSFSMSQYVWETHEAHSLSGILGAVQGDVNDVRLILDGLRDSGHLADAREAMRFGIVVRHSETVSMN